METKLVDHRVQKWQVDDRKGCQQRGDTQISIPKVVVAKHSKNVTSCREGPMVGGGVKREPDAQHNVNLGFHLVTGARIAIGVYDFDSSLGGAHSSLLTLASDDFRFVY